MVSIVNFVLAVLAVLIVLEMLAGMAVIAPYIYTWPLVVVLTLGVAFSVTGILVAKKTESRVPRRFGLLANGSTLILHTVFAFGFIASVTFLLVKSRRERFLIPSGYMGDVFVIYDVRDGEPLTQSRGETTYRIPPSGFLRIQGPMFRGPTRTSYYYEHGDGTVELIANLWLSTIPRTPENLADDKDVGVYFPRTGAVQRSPTTCSVNFEEFYVGTKAHLLFNFHEHGLDQYLNEYPVPCSGK
jgi:hypothetical protein